MPIFVLEVPKMFIKVTTVALIAFCAITNGTCVEWDGLSAKRGLTLDDSFYPLPMNYSSAVSQNWTKIQGADDNISAITLGYYDDPRVILIFDPKSSNVTGIQIGFPAADVDGIVPIDHSKNPYITVKTLNGEKYYTGTALFYQDNEGVRHIEFDRRDQPWLDVPTKSSLVPSATNYLLKNCFEYMGYHYYEINANTSCSAVNPWFLLSSQDDIVGVGFQILGSATSASERTWFETIPIAVVETIIPDVPDCFIDYGTEYGLISLHIWFKADVTSILCSDG